MTKLASLIIVASVALTASAAASAAVAAAVLQVDRGTIMSSEGGEFATARTGKVLIEGQRLMVTEDAAATLRYSNGCLRQYSVPGVYLVAATCELVADASVPAASGAVGAGAGTAATGTAWGIVGAIAAGVAVGAALLDNMEQVDAPPISR